MFAFWTHNLFVYYLVFKDQLPATDFAIYRTILALSMFFSLLKKLFSLPLATELIFIAKEEYPVNNNIVNYYL